MTTRRRFGPRRLLPLMLALSCVAHASFGLLLSQRFALPELEIEVQIPIDVELGMAEAIEGPQTPPAAPEPVMPPAPKPAPMKRAAAADAGLTDAGPPDAGTLHDAGARDADQERLAQSSGDAGTASTRLPAGAQIALRVDMNRIRESPIAPDVRTLLSAIPDWQALLDGSQIDPVTQLERLLIATPNLQREKIVIAGRYLGGREVVEQAVQNLAQARGTEVTWRERRGIAIAPWANADATERVIALVGPAHFTISREEDLDRVLALAAARAGRGAKGRKAAETAGSVADALLSMGDGEGISLEVEGVAQFVRRGRRGIPERLHLSARELPGPGLVLRGGLAYADETAAADALMYWQEKREAYARNTWVRMLGLGSVLENAELRQAGTELEVNARLSVAQTRLLLGYAASLFGVPPPP